MATTLCHLEILREGHHFVGRTEMADGSEKEYKNTVFEDLLTEMLMTLQEGLNDA